MPLNMRFRQKNTWRDCQLLARRWKFKYHKELGSRINGFDDSVFDSRGTESQHVPSDIIM